MNYLITLKCPKKCSFCFSQKINQVMSLDNFKKWVDIDIERISKNIALLGGEPITHPDFGKFVEYALAKNKAVSIFTNLMAPKKNAKDLLRIASANRGISIIWNNSEFEGIPDIH